MTSRQGTAAVMRRRCECGEPARVSFFGTLVCEQCYALDRRRFSRDAGYQRDSVAGRIVARLTATHDELTAEQLAEQISASRNTIDIALGRLVRIGVLLRAGESRKGRTYSLARGAR